MRAVIYARYSSDNQREESIEGQLMESIFEGFSVYYIKDLSMKVSRGMTENVLNGKFNGGALTFGYRIDENKHFQPDPEKAPIVQDIFMRYTSSKSARSILNSLIEQGVKNQPGKKLTYSFVTNILKNRRYLDGTFKTNTYLCPKLYYTKISLKQMASVIKSTIYSICKMKSLIVKI